MKSKTLWLIFATLIILSSCCTDPVFIEPEPPVLPSMPETVILVESSPINEYRLIVQDMRWRMRDAFIRELLGIITEEEYQAEVAEYQRILDLFDQAFRDYQETMNLLD